MKTSKYRKLDRRRGNDDKINVRSHFAPALIAYVLQRSRVKLYLDLRKRTSLKLIQRAQKKNLQPPNIPNIEL